MPYQNTIIARIRDLIDLTVFGVYLVLIKVSIENNVGKYIKNREVHQELRIFDWKGFLGVYGL